MTGLTMHHIFHDRVREASLLASEYMAVVESIGDRALTVRVTPAALHTKAEAGETADMLRWSQTVIDLVERDTTGASSGIGSRLAAAFVSRGIARFSLGQDGWREDFDKAVMTARGTDPLSHAAVVNATYTPAIGAGVLLADDDALRDIENALEMAEQAADDIALGSARFALGLALVHRGEPDCERGFEMLSQVREMSVQQRFLLTVIPLIDMYDAHLTATRGNPDAAIPPLRAAAQQLFERGLPGCRVATEFLVQALLARGTRADVLEAQTAVDRFAASPAGALATGTILLLRLRALVAEAHGDEAAYCDYRDRYRDMAKSLGFEGHMKWAEAMP
jgi:hypothetical protein